MGDFEDWKRERAEQLAAMKAYDALSDEEKYAREVESQRPWTNFVLGFCLLLLLLILAQMTIPAVHEAMAKFMGG